MSYGVELVVDLHECDPFTYDRRSKLVTFFDDLCALIEMEQHDRHFWDYENFPDEYDAAPPHLKGTSAVQFIATSSITVHALDDLRCVYINVFSCKDFNRLTTLKFCREFFKGKVSNWHFLERR